MTAAANASSFRFEEVAGGIGLVTLDQPGRKVNTLDTPSLRELGRLIDRIEGHVGLRGLLFRSGKPGQFIAGADLRELAALEGAPPAHIEALVDLGRAVFGRLAALPFPTVALIDGPCLGGGAELAMALDARLVADGPRTSLALPEVKVGMTPAWGGTQRLPRLTSLGRAIEVIVHGQSLDAARAVSDGLAHAAVAPEALLDAGRALVESLAAAATWPAERRRHEGPVDIAPDEAADLFLATERALEQAGGDDPTPFLALEALRLGHAEPLPQALAAERKIALRVLGSPQAARAIAAFFDRGRPPRPAAPA